MSRPKHFGLPCPACGSPRTRVVDCQPLDDTVRRTRHCRNCLAKFPTHELPAPAAGDHAIHARIATSARRLEALPRHDREALLRILTAFEAAAPSIPVPHLQAAE